MLRSKILSPLIFSLFVIIYTSNPSHGATITIPASSSQNLSTISTNDIVNFNTGSSLLIDTSRTLDSLITSSNNSGIVNFSAANTLTITNDIGTSSAQLDNVIFNADGSLDLKGSSHLNNGITTATTNEGSLILSGSAAQTISSTIGSSSLKLKEISITQDVGAVFNGDVHTTNFVNSGAGVLAISGTGAFNSDSATFNGDATISNSSTTSLGGVTIASGKSLTLNNDSSLTNLIMTSTSNLVVNTSKTASITGNITGTGVIKGDAASKGNLIFSGTAAQTIAAGVETGQSANRLNKISFSNVHASGTTFNNDVFATSLDFTNASGESIVSIATTKTIDVTTDIGQSGAGTSVIKGAGKLNLSGAVAQTIESKLGSSTSDRLGELSLNNTAGASLSSDAYLTTLTSSVANTLTSNALLDVNTLAVNENLTLSGTGATTLSSSTIAAGKTLTLDKNASLTNLTMTDANSNLVVNSGKTASITVDINGTGVIKGAAANQGNILFAGTATQSVAAGVQTGQSTNRLNKISISNIDSTGLTFNNDVFASSLDFTNASGEVKTSIVTGKTIDITGNITQSGAGTSVIKGAGTLKLSGTAAQNIANKLGASTSDRLGGLTINNAAGVSTVNDSFLAALTVSNGSIKVAGDKVMDVTGAVNLSGQTFSTNAGSTNFGQLKSANVITIDNSTTINFDYSNNATTLDTKGTTSYIVAEGTSVTTGITPIATNNSFLFDNKLTVNAANITTTIEESSNLSEATLGADNHKLVVNILQNTDMSAGIGSLATKEELEDALKTTKPMANGAILNATSNIIQSSSKVTTLHIKTINSNISGFATGNKKTSTKGTWGQIFGGGSKQGTRKGERGYSATTIGGIVGIDKMFRPGKSNIILGTAFAYNRSIIRGRSLAKNNDTVDSYQAIFYNNNSRNTGLGFYNENMFNLAFNNYSTNRNIKVGSFEGNAQGDFNGFSYSAKTGFGYNAKISDNFLLTPHASIQYMGLTQDSYTETGAGNNGLHVNNKDYEEVISEVGFDLTSKFQGKNYHYVPRIGLSWQRNLQNNNQESVVSFIGGGSDIQNNSITPGQNKANFSIGIDGSDDYGQSIEVRYDLQAGKRFQSHIGSIQYRKDF